VRQRDRFVPLPLHKSARYAGVKGKNQMYECPHCEKQTISPDFS